MRVTPIHHHDNVTMTAVVNGNIPCLIVSMILWKKRGVYKVHEMNVPRLADLAQKEITVI